MATIHPPITGDIVSLVVPKREKVQVRVLDTAAGWVDLSLLFSPRTSLKQLFQGQVFVEYAGAQGLCRLTGRLGRRPQDAGLRVAGYGTGEALRLERVGPIQLLRRSDLVSAPVTARIVVIPPGRGNELAMEATCVGISGAGLRLRRIDGAKVGERFDFNLFLQERERPVSGTCVVERVNADGIIETRFDTIDAYQRSRLVNYAADHRSGRAA
jgi:hypothetical protein